MSYLRISEVWSQNRPLRLLSKNMIYCLVNVGLSLWEGMADRRISHGNTKLTGNSRTSPSLEQRSHLLGHTKMDSTVRYLGVELEDALAIAEAIEI